MNFDNLIIDNDTATQSRARYNKTGNDKKVYIETYGCQMNFSDTEIILSILSDYGYNETADIEDSDVIFLNTCSIRENAESKIYTRLNNLKRYKNNNPNLVVGILGCMAERLKFDLIEKKKIVDIIIGPDEYRKAPGLIENAIDKGEKGMAIKLSKVETYDEIIPVRKQGVSAWISVMRGCDKFCTFCVVPFTRGRERSRSLNNIVDEAKRLFDSGVKDVWLLGQNVNSYKYETNDFADLLKSVAVAVPQMRVRYTTSHPYDLNVKLLETMAEHKNICKYIHLPVQSGSDRVLKLMNRLYSVEHYMKIMHKAKELMPEIGLSTDIIAGFPSETEEEHRMTLELLKEIKYDSAFTFAYSPRENTKAYRMEDSINDDTKRRRLEEIIELQRKVSFEVNRAMIGKTAEILIETVSKKSDDFMMGRTDCNKSVIVPKLHKELNNTGEEVTCKLKPGDIMNVRINKVNSGTLFA